MNTETVLQYIDMYGYVIIFLFLFFGIVGIPAPEESLLFLIGLLLVHHKLVVGWALLSAILGAYSGMLTAYLCGKYIGLPFINKYGKFVGITIGRWRKAQNAYTKNVKKTIVFGFYIPGIRQISPYFAGIAKTPFDQFSMLALLGTVLWIIPYIVAGYYLGKVFHINPDYVAYLSILFFIIFFLSIFISYIRRKWKKFI